MMKILSLDGGGSGGLATAIYLSEIEYVTGKPIHQLFDLITGVSTGAIIACALGGKMPAAVLVDAYKAEIPRIFEKPWWAPWRGYLFEAKYDKAHLKQAIRRFLPGVSLKSMHTKVMFHAGQVAPLGMVKTKFWKSWRHEDQREPLVDIIAASCSAPTYFPPERLGEDVFVDGAMAVNNPAIPGICEAKRLGWTDIACVSLEVNRTAGMTSKDAASRVSAWDWVPRIFAASATFGQDLAIYEMQSLLGPGRALSARMNLAEPIDAKGAEFYARCNLQAELAWSSTGKEVLDIIYAT